MPDQQRPPPAAHRASSDLALASLHQALDQSLRECWSSRWLVRELTSLHGDGMVHAAADIDRLHSLTADRRRLQRHAVCLISVDREDRAAGALERATLIQQVRIRALGRRGTHSRLETSSPVLAAVWSGWLRHLRRRCLCVAHWCVSDGSAHRVGRATVRAHSSLRLGSAEDILKSVHS